MISFASRRRHEVVRVEDTEGDERRVCKCQLKDEHFDGEQVQFPVFECPLLTRKYGFGTENGLN